MLRWPDVYARSLYDAISRDPSSFDRIITPLEDMDTKMAVMAIAVERNSAAIVQSFLDIGMIAGSPQDTLGTGECNLDSELGYAVRHSADAVVEVLLAARADPNKAMLYDGYSHSALGFAIIHGSTVIVKQLLGAKCDISPCRIGTFFSSASPEYFSPICLAALYGNAEIVSALLEAGADANTVHLCGSTALHFAVEFSNYSEKESSAIISTLVAAGAHLDARNDSGMTPFDKVCCYRQNKLIRAFLELGANPFKNAHEPLVRESILSRMPEAAHFHVHPGIKNAALALVLCLAAVDDAHSFYKFPPEMLIQLLHEMSCVLVLGH